MSNKNEVFEYLIDQLRQQVNNNQCEDLAHEVQSLKNQLRDASAQIKELTCALDCAENEVMCLRSIVDLDPKGAIGYIRRANSAMTDTMRRQYLSKALEELGCKDAPEQSGCRKEDTQECDHNWIIAPGLFIAEGHEGNVPGSRFCCECGVREWDDPEYEPKAYTQKCKHEWEYYYPNGEEHRRCAKCGVIAEQSGCRKEDVGLPVCQCVPAHCGTYHGNTIVCDNCGGVIPE